MFKTKLLTLLFSASMVFSQVTQDWVDRYNGNGNNADKANAIAVDASGNVYVTGQSIGSTSGNDYVTVKYNSSGTVQWSSVYNGSGNGDDWAYSIAVDGSGNVYVTGGSYSGTSTYSDYVTIKYGPDGTELWAAIYDGTGSYNDEAHSIALDGSGNVYVTGQSMGSTTLYDYVTIKYNSNGDEQWVQRYHGPGDGGDRAKFITVDLQGNVYVTGQIVGSSLNNDYGTIKYNTDGTGQWLQIYNGPANNDDVAYSIAVDGSGNVYVTGESAGTGTGNDYATIKYNSAGYEQWVQRYDGNVNGEDWARAMVLDGSANVYVTGRSLGSSVGGDYLTVKYNTSGVQLWTARYNGPGNNVDEANAIALDGSGNVYVTGRSTSAGPNSDYATVMYNSSGSQQWVVRYDGPGNNYDMASSIAVNNSGKVFVTGQSIGNGPGEDYLTIKYSQPIGIKSISAEIPDAYKLMQNYPNPFNPSTNIRFVLPKSSFVRIVVYDAIGREIRTLVNEQLSIGTYETEFKSENFPSGVYYYRLFTQDYSETKKMILIK